MPAPFTHETLMTVYQIFLSNSSAARSIPAWFVWTDVLLVLSFPSKPQQRQDQGVHAAGHGHVHVHTM